MFSERIQVTAKLIGNLRKYGEHQTKIELPQGSTAQDLVNRLGIPEEEEITVMVNEKPKYRHYRLKDGDIVDILRSKEP